MKIHKSLNALKILKALGTGSRKLTKSLIAGMVIGSFLLLSSCSSKSRDLDGIFADGLDSVVGLSLFNLLDNYPALKNAMGKLEPSEFNARLNEGLNNRRSNVSGSLRTLQSVLSNQDAGTRELLFELGNLINRIRTNDPESYGRVLPLLDRIRRGPVDMVPAIIPIRREGLDHLYRTKSQEEMDLSIQKMVDVLQKPENEENFRDIEDLLHKILNRNPNLKTGLAVMIEGLFQGSAPRRGDFRDRLAEALGGLGDSMGKRAGNDQGFKTAGRVLKEFLINTREFSMEGGAFYATGAYDTPNHSAEFGKFLEDLYLAVRRIILTPPNLLRNPGETILSGITKNYHRLGFTGSIVDLDISLAHLGEVDLKGIRRSTSLQADPISALEHLFFTLSLVDKFGYFWNNDPGRPWIVGSSEGILTVGDALHSLSSKMSTTGTYVRQGDLVTGNNTIALTTGDSSGADPMEGVKVDYEVLALGLKENTQVASIAGSTITLKCSSPGIPDTSPCITQTRDNAVLTIRDGDPNSEDSSIANLGVSAIIWNSSITGDVIKNGEVFTFNLNTPALSLLEGESAGMIAGQNDTVYGRTIPWALGMIASTLFSGKAPYYNQNRKDEAGNILTFDGQVYKDSSGVDQIYRSEWQTSRYSIPARNPNNSTENRYVGLGGFNGGDGSNSSSYSGTSYSIREIQVPESDRSVDSDEEAFFKNFQWLLYQKRMVLVIPVAIDALGGALREAAYVTVIGNGLSGLMSVKPYCESTCSEQDIGRWLQSKQSVKGNFKTPERDLENFSDVPGDSVFLVEVWGFGINADTGYGFTDNTVLTQVFNLLFQKKDVPQDFYGPIPPVIRWNFQAIERLGFVNSELVTPDKVAENWNRRNRLLPLIASIAQTLRSQADSGIENVSLRRDPFVILSDLADVLARPYRLDGVDPTTNQEHSVSVSIPLYRIRGYSGPFGIRSPSMDDPGLYYPSDGLRSPFSILLENNRRMNDGLLNLIGKGGLFTGLGQFLYELGREENDIARAKFNQGLQFILNEIRPADQITQAETQFNLTSAIQDLKDFIVTERSGRLSDGRFLEENIYDDVAEFLSDFLGNASPYSYTPNLKEIFRSLAFAGPNLSESNAFLDLVNSLLQNQRGERDYYLTKLLREDLSRFLFHSKGNTRELVGLLEGLARPNGFLPWFWARTVSDFSADAILRDAEKFLQSPEVQNRERGRNDLFYNTGELLGLFANMTDKPRDPGSMPHWFPDHWNKDENVDTLFDRLNFLLSKK